ncbi:AAA family ATPase [Fictibacillus sp. WQ 8-8]|uniref:ATP-dependent nuclease n=1 Tax=Fictibacillus sp. WQ 8-8 TaxID=2938788 RepID=UPI00210A77C5|nr:AAA family ATPase [Fictibacillus sp. WQ 8-8]MCQ6267892.1 AAA family ATPase [Fictibacillus sp. WQ 8-8]
MYISQLMIRNFRNFDNAIFSFNKGVNSLIGENGAGKTNALFAIRLLIDTNLPIKAAQLIETDFNRNLGDWRGHWIIIRLEFKDLAASEGTQMLSNYIEDMDTEEDKGTYNFHFMPTQKIRKDLYKLSEQIDKDKEKLKSILDTITINDYESVFCFRGSVDFTDEEIYRKYVGDFENIIFPNPEEESKEALGEKTSQLHLIRNEISCTFIKALRNVVNDLRNSKSSPLLNLLRGTSKDIQVENFTEIMEMIKKLNKTICELDEIGQLSEKIKKTLINTIGHTYAPNISIKSELPEDINKLMQSLTLWVSDTEESGFESKLEDLSLGGANLLYITLKLLEYEFKQPKEEKAAHFLLIEEPEAHIHTHIQKTIFENYSFQNTQVIISTHSTHISSVNKISSINILCKENQRTNVCQPNNGLSDDECKRIERYLDAIRSTILFAKGVILVEGDAELILIPALFKKVYGISLDEIGVSIINMSSTVFKHICITFFRLSH